ncbi:TetR/AcrR family transcriptional regulator [Acidovorax sp. HMWF018]|uniref:TetR/AcrR family transcriptional regulator n=1 Tax=Acidovorax sp. HMWF018 TaxID=2056855 RepID=UPI001304AF61|nr:TetR/AcrR family transcriptional regulator [Acidovorax sp. HMWF018]
MKVRTEARREAILEVASQVFLELGFERASMSEIVKRIGGSKSTIYGYFPSKEALFLAVSHAAGERHMASSISELESYAGQGLRETLTGFAQQLLVFLGSREAIAAHRMVLGATADSDIGQMFYESGPKRGQQAVAELLQQAMDHREVRVMDPWLAAQYFGAIVNAEFQHRWFLPDAPAISQLQAREAAGRAIDVFARAFFLDKS